jgi:hypothetical protein
MSMSRVRIGIALVIVGIAMMRNVTAMEYVDNIFGVNQKLPGT